MVESLTRPSSSATDHPWGDRVRPAIAMLVVVIGSSVARAQAERADDAFFETKIRPILAEHCFKCHGPKKTSGGLRLDSGAALARGGQSGAVIVAGQPEKSLVIQALRHQENAELRLPPD